MGELPYEKGSTFCFLVVQERSSLLVVSLLIPFNVQLDGFLR